MALGGVKPGAAAALAIRGDLLRQFIHALVHEIAEHAEALAARLGIRLPVDAGEPDRQLLLHRLGKELHRERAAARRGHLHLLTAPELLDNLQVLDVQLTPFLERIRREDEVVRMPAGGDGDRRTAVGEIVDHGPLLRHAHRVVQRQDHAAAAQLQLLRLERERAGQQRRVRREATHGMKMALRQPDRGEAVLVRKLRGIDQQRVLVVAISRVVVAKEVEAELHRARRDAEGRGQSSTRRDNRGRCGTFRLG